jgi:hypothetical protein
MGELRSPRSVPNAATIGSAIAARQFTYPAPYRAKVPQNGVGRPSTHAVEAVKESRNEQRHLAQSRKGAEAEKKVKDLLASTLCVSASLREMPYFFTPSLAWAVIDLPFGAQEQRSSLPRPVLVEALVV